MLRSQGPKWGKGFEKHKCWMSNEKVGLVDIFCTRKAGSQYNDSQNQEERWGALGKDP
jgi:hypothetical protein